MSERPQSHLPEGLYPKEYQQTLGGIFARVKRLVTVADAVVPYRNTSHLGFFIGGTSIMLGAKKSWRNEYLQDIRTDDFSTTRLEIPITVAQAQAIPGVSAQTAQGIHRLTLVIQQRPDLLAEQGENSYGAVFAWELHPFHLLTKGPANHPQTFLSKDFSQTGVVLAKGQGLLEQFHNPESFMHVTSVLDRAGLGRHHRLHEEILAQYP